MSYDERIIIYYGDAVMRAGFLTVPHLFMRHYAALGLNADQAMFAMQLMSITWDLAQPPDTMKKLAQRMGVSVRTAQRYSEQLTEHGLLTVYEQFAAGAQVENGYDLTPLFKRLAEYAPEPRPGGEPRERRVRQGAAQYAVDYQTPVMASEQSTQRSMAVSTHDTSDIRPHDTSDALPHDTSVIPTHVNPDTPIGDITDIPGMTPMTGLKEESRTKTKNKQKKKQQHVAAADDAKVNVADVIPEQVGFSIRLDQELSSIEVMQSRKILALIGINADVADTVALSLHPGECWAIWLYARAHDLGTGWIARQLYDPQQRRARIAGIPHPYDAPGRLLAELPTATASTLLDLALQPSPAYDSDASLLTTDIPASTKQEIVASIHAAFGNRRTSQQISFEQPALPLSLVQQKEDHGWSRIRQRLQASIAAEDFETWIAPLNLVTIEDQLVVLVTPNVFVRNEVRERFVATIAEVTATELGYPCRIELVIDQQLAA